MGAGCSFPKNGINNPQKRGEQDISIKKNNLTIQNNFQKQKSKKPGDTIKTQIKSNQLEQEQSLKFIIQTGYKIGPHIFDDWNKQQNAKNLKKNENQWSNSISKANKEKKSKKIIEQLPEHIKNYLKTITEEELFIFKLQEKDNYLKQLSIVSPPAHLRWSIWKIRFLDIHHFDPTLFDLLQVQKTNQEKQIEKDIDRTFPKQDYFKLGKNTQSYGQIALSRVLKAISVYCPQMGYTQGMNFIVGFLLLINGGNESEAFWLFIELCRHKDFMIMGIFEQDFPVLNLILFIFKKKFQEHLPKLQEDFMEKGMIDQFWIWKWYLSLFVSNFPLEFSVRAWDYLVSTDIFAIIKISIAFLKINEQKLLDMPEISEVSDFFSNIQEDQDMFIDKNSQNYFDIDNLLKEAQNVTIQPSYIRTCTKEYTDQLSQQDPTKNSIFFDYFKHYGQKKNEEIHLRQKILKYKFLDPLTIKENIIQIKKGVQLIKNKNTQINEIQSQKSFQSQEIKSEPTQNLQYQQLQLQQQQQIVQNPDPYQKNTKYQRKNQKILQKNKKNQENQVSETLSNLKKTMPNYKTPERHNQIQQNKVKIKSSSELSNQQFGMSQSAQQQMRSSKKKTNLITNQTLASKENSISRHNRDFDNISDTIDNLEKICNPQQFQNQLTEQSEIFEHQSDNKLNKQQQLQEQEQDKYSSKSNYKYNKKNHKFKLNHEVQEEEDDNNSRSINLNESQNNNQKQNEEQIKSVQIKDQDIISFTDDNKNDESADNDENNQIKQNQSQIKIENKQNKDEDDDVDDQNQILISSQNQIQETLPYDFQEQDKKISQKNINTNQEKITEQNFSDKQNVTNSNNFQQNFSDIQINNNSQNVQNDILDNDENLNEQNYDAQNNDLDDDDDIVDSENVQNTDTIQKEEQMQQQQDQSQIQDINSSSQFNQLQENTQKISCNYETGNNYEQQQGTQKINLQNEQKSVQVGEFILDQSQEKSIQIHKFDPTQYQKDLFYSKIDSNNFQIINQENQNTQEYLHTESIYDTNIINNNNQTNLNKDINNSNNNINNNQTNLFHIHRNNTHNNKISQNLDKNLQNQQAKNSINHKKLQRNYNSHGINGNNINNNRVSAEVSQYILQATEVINDNNYQYNNQNIYNNENTFSNRPEIKEEEDFTNTNETSVQNNFNLQAEQYV
ncbi:Rab-GTPase-TBC domain [Pseudocohnilembus persalinus]|uniref:Rab-GTPase-TBC domain n=1 Tax=Pseudocohnilembus persalinus TaxID=266149 RepID=A0A0V0QSR6_PSEPJ|nr:Rab-GTPase-TBC domain [Pseudocohnilembus persalinus]|eukprot:KRX05358.1 Rab-GTPase-TBC domain [Pseudocohnilembus persalinus]